VNNYFLIEGLKISVLTLLNFGMFAFIVFAFVNRYIFDNNLKKLYIATSPFVFILIGYLFRILNVQKIFPIVVLVLAIISILSFFNLNKNYKKIEIKLSFLIFTAIAFYFYFYDAVKHWSIAHIDAYATHLQIVNLNLGVGNPYQPGMAIILSPIYLTKDPSYSLNFLGAAVGISVLLLVSIIFRIINLRMWFIFIIILILPYFDNLFTTLNGLGSSIISFLTLTILIISSYAYSETFKLHYIILIVISLVATGLTSPVFNFYLIAPSLFILLLSRIRKHNINKLYFWIASANFIGLAIFIFNLLVTNVYTKYRDQSNISLVDNLKNTLNLVNSASNQNFFKEWFFVRTIEIRKLDSVEAIIALIILIVAIAMLFWFRENIKYQKFELTLILTIFFGMGTIFSLFDHPYIKGRVGLLFIWNVILFSSYIFNYIYSEASNKYHRNLSMFPAALTILILIFVKPTEQYRYLDEAAYKKLVEIIDSSYRSYDIALWSDYPIQTSNNTKNMEFATVGVNVLPETNQQIAQIVLLDFKTELIDPVRSRKYGFELMQSAYFKKNLTQENRTKIANSKIYEKKIQEIGFNKLWENQNFKIYVNEFK
jgi:hypothetical protein